MGSLSPTKKKAIERARAQQKELAHEILQRIKTAAKTPEPARPVVPTKIQTAQEKSREVAKIADNNRRRAHYETLFDNGKQWYSSKEAAGVLGVSAQFVREAFESQALMGQEVASNVHARKIKLVHRDCLIVYLMESANYAPEDFVERMKRLLLRRPMIEQDELRTWLDKTRMMGVR